MISIHQNKTKLALLSLAAMTSIAQADLINFIYTSDNHYGINRPIFQGQFNVSGQVVNEAMIAKMNTLPSLYLPSDGGAGAGLQVGNISFLADTGDIANRSETQSAYTGATVTYLGQQVTTQSASAYTVANSAVTWGQYQHDFLGDSNTSTNLSGGLLTLTDGHGNGIPIYLSPGNHDVSDAIGMASKVVGSSIDTTSFTQIYNREIGNQAGTPMTPVIGTAMAYPANSINYSKDIGGVHMMFVNMFPDKNVQTWMNTDLAGVSSTTPVLLFTHVPINMAASETKVFGNPVSPTSSAAGDIPFTLSGSNSANSYTDMNAAKQDVANWLILHPNVKAYFSGHDNFNGATVWNGQDANGNLILPGDANWSGINLFRVDSPMKGDFSGVSAANGIGDETQLSFQVYTMDTATQTLTERPYYWDSTGVALTSGSWGASTTVNMGVVPEPGSCLMLTLGGLAMLGLMRRRVAA